MMTHDACLMGASSVDPPALASKLRHAAEVASVVYDYFIEPVASEPPCAANWTFGEALATLVPPSLHVAAKPAQGAASTASGAHDASPQEGSIPVISAVPLGATERSASLGKQ